MPPPQFQIIPNFGASFNHHIIHGASLRPAVAPMAAGSSGRRLPPWLSILDSRLLGSACPSSNRRSPLRRAVAKRVAFVPVIALSFLLEARRLAKTDVHSDTRTGTSVSQRFQG